MELTISVSGVRHPAPAAKTEIFPVKFPPVGLKCEILKAGLITPKHKVSVESALKLNENRIRVENKRLLKRRKL